MRELDGKRRRVGLDSNLRQEENGPDAFGKKNGFLSCKLLAFQLRAYGWVGAISA
jgi:hypothetical protein